MKLVKKLPTKDFLLSFQSQPVSNVVDLHNWLKFEVNCSCRHHNLL